MTIKVEVFESDGSVEVKEQLEEFFEDHPNAEVVGLAQSETRFSGSGTLTFPREITTTLLYREK